MMAIFKHHNQSFITSELLPFSKLIEPNVVNLLKKYRFGLCLCLHDDQLNEELDQLCLIYQKAGIQLIFWPLLSIKDGLYLNKYSVTEYYHHLDEVFDWIDSRKYRIFGLLVDVEPDYIKPNLGSSPVFDNIWHSLREMDEDAFNAAIIGFKKIITKIRKQGCKAIGAAVPFVCNDKLEHSKAWEDYWGGPVACVDWDILVFMLYGSWFVQMGMNWPTAHRLIYDYTKTAKKFWKTRVVIALGVTTAGTGAETALYKSPAQLAEAVSAVKAAGINKVAVYDIKGIIDSTDQELWFKKILSAPPLIPTMENEAPNEHVEPFKIILYNLCISVLGKLLEMIRLLKNVVKKFSNAFIFTKKM